MRNEKKLHDIIDFLGKQFLNINKLWLVGSSYERINLKKNLVKDIYNNKNFIRNIRGYQSFLIDATIELNLTLEGKYNVISRVKTPNSIEDKIRRYNSDIHENGKIAICKCLNDLFGARVILDEEISFSTISSFIETEETFRNKQVGLKCINSSKNGYEATHIYFKKEKDNSIFQWELQIWDTKNAGNNIESHKKYKQKYTHWESEMVERME